jgi:hypothetical protein
MGVAVGDVDGDGKFDLLVTNFTTEGSSLYLQKSGGLFAEETRDRGLFEASKPHTGWGTVFADFDHDGDLDLAVANGLVVPCRLNFAPHGEEEQVATRRPVADVAAYWRDYHDVNQMFANDGTGHFNDVSRQAGDFTLTLGSARALLAGDYDNDGDLDLLATYCGERARLYQNNAPRRETNWVQIRVTEPALGGRIAYGAEVEITGKGKSWRQTVSPQSSYLANHDPRLHFGLGTVDEIEKVTVRWVGGGVETFPGGQVRRLMTIERGTGQPAVALGPSASGASSAP